MTITLKRNTIRNNDVSMEVSTCPDTETAHWDNNEGARNQLREEIRLAHQELEATLQASDRAPTDSVVSTSQDVESPPNRAEGDSTSGPVRAASGAVPVALCSWRRWRCLFFQLAISALTYTIYILARGSKEVESTDRTPEGTPRYYSDKVNERCGHNSLRQRDTSLLKTIEECCKVE